MKIESVVINISRRVIYHIDSEGQKEHKIKRKEAESEFIAFVEEQINKRNGQLHTILTTPAGWRAILIFE